jgi:hypothetical protein
VVRFGLRVGPVKREIPSTSLRAGSSLRLKSGYAQDDKHRVMVKLHPRLGTGGGGECFVELFLGAGANLVEFSMQTPDFRIEFDEVEALGGDEAIGFHSGVVLLAAGFQIDAGGRQLRSGVGVQIHKIQARSFHDRAIMARFVLRNSIKSGSAEKPRPYWEDGQDGIFRRQKSTASQ